MEEIDHRHKDFQSVLERLDLNHQLDIVGHRRDESLHAEVGALDLAGQVAATLALLAARADKGAAQRPGTPKLHFASYRQLHATLTEKRMALLEHVAVNDVQSIRQLAGQLGRDYRNVYDDVQCLVQIGLIEIEAGVLHVPYDEIDIRKTLREAV